MARSPEAPIQGWLWRVFMGDDGLRGGWRALVFWLCALWTMGLLLGAVSWLWGEREIAPWMSLGISALLLVPIVFLNWGCAFVIDRQGIASTGLGGPWRRSLAELIGGWLGGATTALVAGGAIVNLAGGSWDLGSFSWSAWLGWAALFGAAAAWEELLFRGYAFQWLSRSVGRAESLVFFSLFFTFAHGFNPHVSTLGLFNIGLASTALCLAVFATDRMWLPIGLHWGLNMGQAMILGLAVSGLGSENNPIPSLLQTQTEGPVWITGGAFGLEGSVALSATLVVLCAALSLFVVRRTKKA